MIHPSRNPKRNIRYNLGIYVYLIKLWSLRRRLRSKGILLLLLAGRRCRCFFLFAIPHSKFFWKGWGWKCVSFAVEKGKVDLDGVIWCLVVVVSCWIVKGMGWDNQLTKTFLYFWWSCLIRWIPHPSSEGYKIYWEGIIMMSKKIQRMETGLISLLFMSSPFISLCLLTYRYD